MLCFPPSLTFPRRFRCVLLSFPRLLLQHQRTETATIRTEIHQKNTLLHDDSCLKASLSHHVVGIAAKISVAASSALKATTFFCLSQSGQCLQPINRRKRRSNASKLVRSAYYSLQRKGLKRWRGSRSPDRPDSRGPKKNSKPAEKSNALQEAKIRNRHYHSSTDPR